MNIDLQGLVLFLLLASLWHYMWRRSRDRFYFQLTLITLVLAGFSFGDYLIRYIFHSPPLLKSISYDSFRVVLLLGVALVFILFFKSHGKPKQGNSAGNMTHWQDHDPSQHSPG